MTVCMWFGFCPVVLEFTSLNIASCVKNFGIEYGQICPNVFVPIVENKIRFMRWLPEPHVVEFHELMHVPQKNI